MLRRERQQLCPSRISVASSVSLMISLGCITGKTSEANVDFVFGFSTCARAAGHEILQFSWSCSKTPTNIGISHTAYQKNVQSERGLIQKIQPEYAVYATGAKFGILE